MRQIVSGYAPPLLARPRIQSVCAFVVVVGSFLPWARIPAEVFNFMYLAGMESGLEVYGRYTLTAGVAAVALGIQSRDRRRIRIASGVIAGLVIVASLVWIFRVTSYSGFNPAIGAFLTLLGGLGLLTAELADLR